MKELTDKLLANQPDARKECSVCSEIIPIEEGIVPEEGTDYAIVRENNPESPYVMTEGWIHMQCLEEYLRDSEED